MYLLFMKRLKFALKEEKVRQNQVEQITFYSLASIKIVKQPLFYMKKAIFVKKIASLR
jgi:hypothetical protein